MKIKCDILLMEVGSDLDDIDCQDFKKIDWNNFFVMCYMCCVQVPLSEWVMGANKQLSRKLKKICVTHHRQLEVCRYNYLFC